MPKHQPKGNDFLLTNVKLKPNTLILLGVGAFFLLLSVIQPSIFSSSYYSAAVQSGKLFEVNNYAQAGRFRNTPHIGGSSVDLESTFYGVHVLSHHDPIELSNPNKTQEYVFSHKDSFSRDSRIFYQSIHTLNKLHTPLSEDQKTKYYETILSLQENESGFRITRGDVASISGTYYAFQLIKELGKFDQFSSTTDFQAALNFVVSLKDSQSHGFKDRVKEEPTLQATWFATKILSTISNQHKNDQAQVLRKAVEGLDTFVLQCQTQDGGFVDRPRKTVDQIYYGASNTANTAKALYVLEFSYFVNQYRSVDGYFSPYSRALNYLRSSISFSGVRNELGGRVDLETTYYFFELIDSFPSVSYGVPVEYSSLMVTIGFILLLVSVFPLYKHLSPTPEATQRMYSEGLTALVFLVLSYVVMKTLPSLTVLVYLAFAFYLSLEMYKLQYHKDMTEDLFLVALINSTIYLGAVFGMVYVAPYIFSHVTFFSVLVGIGAVSTAITTIGAPYFIPTKLEVMLIVAFQAWVFNVVGQYVYLYGRGDFSLIFRVIKSSGQIPVVFVLVPFALLVVTFYITTIASSVKLFPPVKEPSSKKARN
jgi:hypothetical protein